MSSAQYRCSLSHTSHVTDRQSGLGVSPVEKSLASLPRDDARLNLACRRSQSAVSSLTGRTAQCSSTLPHPLPLSVLSHHLHLSLCPFSLCHWPASLTRALVFPSAPGTASSRKQNSLCEQCAVKDEGGICWSPPRHQLRHRGSGEGTSGGNGSHALISAVTRAF